LSVSIVSHNSRDDLEGLMPSLVDCLKGIDSEILVVDNMSDDRSVAFLRQEYPSVKITVNKNRKGYGANHNINLKKAAGRFIVFMNSDIVLMPDTIMFLKNFMEQNKQVGICCPNVLNKDGSLQFLNKRYPTIFDLFLRRFRLLFTDRLVEKRSNYYEMRDCAYDTSMDVPFISGCFMFCRSSVIRKVDGFDERFFLYFEDVDLCRKVQKTNRTVSCPDAKLIHRWHRSSYSEFKWFLVFLRSAFLYFNKWGYLLY
jgi:hypothetical protein